MTSSLFILGCGRSGTSMLAGLFRDAGYFMGEHLHPPRSSNPKGFFESPSINQLNEDILAPHLPTRDTSAGRGYGFDIPIKGHRWLAHIPPNRDIEVTQEHVARIRALTALAPFCYKDPRFCYTLPAWLDNAPTASCICVFRHPAAFVDSVFTEVRSFAYLHNFAVSVDQLMMTWRDMYTRIVDRHAGRGRWHFVEYERLLDGQGLESLALFTQARIDYSFPDKSLRRSVATIALPEDVAKLYARLQDLANANV